MAHDSDLIPLRIRRHHTAWLVESGHFELQPHSKFGAWLYEALDTDAPADAHVNCCLLNKVQFYKDSSEHESGKFHNYKQAEHRDFNDGWTNGHLLHVGGAWWKVCGGMVLRRNERWVFRHELARNRRLAHNLNKGPRGDSYAPTLDHLMKGEVEYKGHVLHCGNCRERWFQPTFPTFKHFTYCPFCNQEVRPIEQEGAAPAHERVEQH